MRISDWSSDVCSSDLIGRTVHILDDSGYLVCRREQCSEVIAVDLDGDIAAHAGQEFVEAQLDRLTQLVNLPRQLRDGFLQALEQRRLREVGIRPRLPRLPHAEPMRDAGASEERLGGKKGGSKLK